jgi:hypothetical protein
VRTRKALVYFSASVFAIALLDNCASSRAPQPRATHIIAEPEVLSQASAVGFPYARILLRAERRDLDALRQLMEFSVHTDAFGGVTHGIVLVQLRDVVGRADFDRTLAAVSARGREATQLDMQTALSMINPPNAMR